MVNNPFTKSYISGRKRGIGIALDLVGPFRFADFFLGGVFGGRFLVIGNSEFLVPHFDLSFFEASFNLPDTPAI